ncbi:MAG: HAMP domain-containing sensor histidine kinase [Saprospiraceae bacterium]
MSISFFLTHQIVSKLQLEENKRMMLWAAAQKEFNLSSADPNADISLQFDIMNANTTIPLILVDEKGKISEVKNWGKEFVGNEAYFKKQLNKLKKSGHDPIKGSGYATSIYYRESTILVLLQYFPILQFLLFGAFVTFAYFGFSSARRAEQNRVWVGMAKETAHQLGTPISAIIAWIEHLRNYPDNSEDQIMVVNELARDVSRLEVVADRFSKIGSDPTLKSVNILEVLDQSRDYMQIRAPRKVRFEFPDPSQVILAKVNAPLFDWVMENLLRNALDAMEGTGLIKCVVTEEKDHVVIDLSDSGKGIPTSKFSTVFDPGFTTKKRGWGLGLSLCKRIISEYHKGEIFVKSSSPQEGTTFSIRLHK